MASGAEASQTIERESVSGRSGLSRMLRPRSIAIAGANPDPATMGGAILANCERFEFAGDIHLISPTRKELGGRDCIASAADLPTGVDAVVLNVPRAAIREAAEQCARQGVGGVVVFAAGFGEAGPEGAALQDELASICGESGMAMLGPNCLGYVNYAGGIGLSFEPLAPRPLAGRRTVAVIAQSGAVSSAIRGAMQGRGIAISLAVATGNEAVTTTSDIVDFVVEQGGTDAIIIYAEQIRNPAAFLQSAARARAARVPIIVLHPGRSQRGREAAQSHTGSMVGNHGLMRCALEREAVVVVDTLDELLDTAALIHRYPVPSPGELAIVTNSGAIRGMSFDFAEDAGLDLAQVSDETKARLGEMLPGSEIDNPLDIGTAGYVDGSIFTRTSEAMLADPDVSAVLLSLTGGGPAQQRAKAEALIPLTGSTKPVAMVVVGDGSDLDAEFIRTMHQHAIPLYRSPERAIRAFAALDRYAADLGEAERRSPAADLNFASAGGGVQPEYLGKDLLRTLGIPVPEGALATTVDEAHAIAARIGYPVVIKAQAATLAHKSDVGGVLLNIADEAALTAAWKTLHANIGAVALDGVLVEKMSSPGVEMILGASMDEEWGASVMVGLGGVLTEALAAITLIPADATHEQAKTKILALRGASLFGAFRGKAARDVDAIADAVVKLGSAIRAGTNIEQIEINPLVVHQEGHGATALDALVVTRQNTATESAR
ncbi:acetate--CoA ligase family protein [Novosphingobium aquimarinum]|uniref:acetate--CoA ligase family protein n=1 Tax=Novosphingobium aquimarinum TaxID=2682494 RepID=UPI0018DDA07F|nr:acetate--CoA ligase family protein [Novosphingobium aquimarinum]